MARTRHGRGIAPHVSIRTLREQQKLSFERLARRITELTGEVWHPDHLNNVELGHKPGSPALFAAWALALGIDPTEIVTDAQIRALLAAKDERSKAVA